MIFKRLKKKSNQKYLNNSLNNRKPLVDESVIQSVGVILNSNEFKDSDQLLSLLRSLDIKENKIKFITFIDDHNQGQTAGMLIFILKILNGGEILKVLI